MAAPTRTPPPVPSGRGDEPTVAGDSGVSRSRPFHVTRRHPRRRQRSGCCGHARSNRARIAFREHVARETARRRCTGDCRAVVGTSPSARRAAQSCWPVRGPEMPSTSRPAVPYTANSSLSLLCWRSTFATTADSRVLASMGGRGWPSMSLTSLPAQRSIRLPAAMVLGRVEAPAKRAELCEFFGRRCRRVGGHRAEPEAIDDQE